MSEYVVELKNITKRFPGVVALKNMSIGIRPGEIHGLIGENGAGKSTLIKVLTGVHTPEEGEIYVDGQKVVFHNPVQSREAGIACVYQELNIVKQLSVTDNVFMGRAVKKNGLLDYPRMYEEAKQALTTLGHPEIDVKMECGKLGTGQQQMVEIAKAVSLDAKLIIMDEPTSSLGKEEINQLMETVRGLKAKGVAILFVSHKLEALFELCDRVTVMRDGEHIVTQDIGDMTEDSLINAMVGRTLDNLYPKEFGVKGDVWLEARNLNEAGVLHDVSFKAYGGQITGFAGLVGAGRTETMRAIFGADRLDSGEIYVKGEKVHIRTPKDAIKKKIAFLTEDRKGQGLVLSLDVRTNLILANMKGFSNGPFLNKGKIEKSGQDNVESLRIKTPSLDEVTAQLSGGNQQKVVIGKWVTTDADILIFAAPTRGIAVGAIYTMSVKQNMTLANLFRMVRLGVIRTGYERQTFRQTSERLSVKYAKETDSIKSLSGGNQQKVILGRWIMTSPQLLILDEPTRGIDVGAKIEVYHVMNDLVKAGKCVIMVSSELPEILAMSDHVVVMRGGRVMANIDRDTPHFNSEDIMKAAWGGELD